MLAIHISTLSYLWLAFKAQDVLDIITLTLLLLTIIYATYIFENRDKLRFVQMKNIQQMNEELQAILMNLPEGIVLVNKEN